MSQQPSPHQSTREGDAHEGGCLCGAVRYTMTGPLRALSACYCGQCRKQSGNYVVATGVPLDRLAVTNGGAIGWFAASGTAQRGFCKTCGTLLFWMPADEDRVSVMVGTLDHDPGLSVVREIHTQTAWRFHPVTHKDVRRVHGD